MTLDFSTKSRQVSDNLKGIGMHQVPDPGIWVPQSRTIAASLLVTPKKKNGLEVKILHALVHCSLFLLLANGNDGDAE